MRIVGRHSPKQSKGVSDECTSLLYALGWRFLGYAGVGISKRSAADGFGCTVFARDIDAHGFRIFALRSQTVSSASNDTHGDANQHAYQYTYDYSHVHGNEYAHCHANSYGYSIYRPGDWILDRHHQPRSSDVLLCFVGWHCGANVRGYY